jgi:hypothetical protein
MPIRSHNKLAEEADGGMVSDGFGAAFGAGAALSLAGAFAGLSLRSRRGAVEVAPPAVPAPESPSPYESS